MATYFIKAAALAAMTTLTSQAAQADSGLGIIGGDLLLGYSNQTGEGGYVAGTLDVAITQFHGAQFDLQYEERSTGAIGRIGTVLYMTPRQGQKYGLSLMVADRNNASATYGQLGAAGMFQIGEDVNLEVRASVGLSSKNDLDWIGIGAGVHWQATTATRLYAHYDLTEFDEASFRARANEVTFGVQTRLNNSPVSLFAEASRDWLSGRNAAGADTTIRAGLSISLGRRGNNQPSFRVADPTRQLLRRGLF